MASDKKISQFPDVQNKLQAPTKKSLFERQKAEAEAKKRREEAETKAAYDDFVKSFDDEDEDAGNGFRGGRGEESSRFRGGGISGPPKRHYGAGFGAPSMGQAAGRGFGGDRGRGASGPGSLGPSPGLGRKRTYENFQQPPRRDDRGLLAFEDYDDQPAPSKDTRNEEDSRRVDIEEARALAKPTLRLANLPPATSPAVIKALIPSNLKVDAVRIQAVQPSPGSSERKSVGAIVTLASETAANDIDMAVNGLQNRYLGYGYYLNLHRHLSSSTISNSTSLSGPSSSTASQPFGAKPVVIASAGRGHAPPHRGGFAPPTSYETVGPGQQNRGPPLHVPVQAPQDIKELKLIHKVIESLITHGPEFEALLMTRPDVQREEKWAWLWDPRSTGGVWYRWRLWEVLTGSQTQRGKGKYLPLFEGSSAWKAPDQPLIFEYTTRLDEFVSDSEYNSSDEDESGDEGARKPNHAGGGPPDPNILADEGKAYLNPLEKAKLTHLLSRLPTSIGQLRKGDVARVTAFAISHAGRGADEVVAAIISNVEKPFAYTSANPDRKKDKDSVDETAEEEDNDTSSASLIGVYIISDILSSSSTSGVRHAWRYRQLFETALKQRNVFEGLGRMERKMNWGKLRAEKWKRSVGNMLSLWEGWCVFPQESQEHFVTVFNNPPMTMKEEQEARQRDTAVADKGKSKWKTVEVTAKEEIVPEAEVDGEPMEEDDVDGEPMDDDDVDGVPMEDEDEDIDGMPMDEDVEETLPVEEADPAPPEPKLVEVKKDAPPVQTRKRPKAVDMFADSDDED